MQLANDEGVVGRNWQINMEAPFKYLIVLY